MNTARLKVLAKDLRKRPPCSSHEKLGGFVIAASMFTMPKKADFGAIEEPQDNAGLSVRQRS